jgi:sigma-B regulation protein RsbU (phosphoserine phosphatase)
MKSDLEAAAKIQKSLLPKEYLEIQNANFSYAFKPCEELGGDILNVFQLDENHVGLYILDVSGHGIPAALLSVTLSRVMSPIPGQSSLLLQQIAGSSKYRLVSPVEVAEQLNWQFLMDTESAQYFTLIYGILNLATHEFRYVSAGHPGLIYLARESEPTTLEKFGGPIGFIRETKFKEFSVRMKPGDRLYLYSDGVTEATNPNEEEFGEQQLLRTLDRNRDLLIKDSISSLLKSVEEWHGNGRFEDDVSVLAVEIADRAAQHAS